MSSADFSKSMTRVLAYEGGYSNHPKDPGGVTLEGVIQRVYDGYRDRKGLPRKTLIPAMRGTADWIRERDEIYRIQYWNKIRGDELPAGIDVVVFDGAVNSGPVQSIKWLQRALRMNNVDGELGEATMAAIEACGDNDILVADICSRRLAFMQQLKTWSTFKDGWSKRVSNVKATGQAWASGSVGPQPVNVVAEGGNAKANGMDLAEAPVSVGAGTVTSTGSTVAVGITDQLQQATTQLTPLADSLQIIKYVLLAIGVAIALLTLYGVYRNWKATKARNGEDTAVVPAEGEF